VNGSGKDMSVHIPVCTNYDFNVLTPVAWNFDADKTCVFLRLVAKMSGRF
jgi:hypothetical protein